MGRKLGQMMDRSRTVPYTCVWWVLFVVFLGDKANAFVGVKRTLPRDTILHRRPDELSPPVSYRYFKRDVPTCGPLELHSLLMTQDASSLWVAALLPDIFDQAWVLIALTAAAATLAFGRGDELDRINGLASANVLDNDLPEISPEASDLVKASQTFWNATTGTIPQRASPQSGNTPMEPVLATKPSVIGKEAETISETDSSRIFNSRTPNSEPGVGGTSVDDNPITAVATSNNQESPNSKWDAYEAQAKQRFQKLNLGQHLTKSYMATADLPQLEAATTDVVPSSSSPPSPKLETAAVSSTVTPIVEAATPFSQPSDPVESLIIEDEVVLSEPLPIEDEVVLSEPLPIEDEVVLSEPLPTEDEILASTTRVDNLDGEESFSEGKGEAKTTTAPVVELTTPLQPPAQPVESLPVEDEVLAYANTLLNVQREKSASATKNDYEKPHHEPAPIPEAVHLNMDSKDESLVEPVEVLNDDDNNNLDEKGKQSLPTDESIFNLMQQRNMGAQVMAEEKDPVALQHALKLRQQHEEDMEKIRRKYAEDQARQLPTLHKRSRVKEQVGKEWLRRQIEELKEQEEAASFAKPTEPEQEEEPPQTTETPKSAELKQMQADQEWVRKRTQEIKADTQDDKGESPPPTMRRKTRSAAMKASSRSTSSQESSLDWKEERAQRILDQQRSDMDMVRQYVKEKEQNQLKEQISKVITSPRERRSNVDTEDNDEEEEAMSSIRLQEIEMENLLDEISGDDVVEDTIVEIPKSKAPFFSRMGGKGEVSVPLPEDPKIRGDGKIPKSKASFFSRMGGKAKISVPSPVDPKIGGDRKIPKSKALFFSRMGGEGISVPSRENPKTGGDKKKMKTSFSPPRVVKKKDESVKDASIPKTNGGRDKKKFKSGVYMTNVEKGHVGGQKVEVVRKMSPRINSFTRRKRLVVATILLFIGQKTLRTILTRSFLL